MNIRKLKISTTALALVVVTIVAAVVAGVLFFNGQQAKKGSLLLGTGPSASSYKLEVVSDSAAQAKGLSGRKSLGKNEGMLFKYDNSTQRCMWMKDMNFNLDIIWLDANHRVTSIVPDLTPASYPQSFCAEAQYVIELNAGQAAQHGLRLGQIVNL